jgi:hypothetical protein
LYFELRLLNSLTFISDSILSITLNNLIFHTQVESEADSVNLDFYLDYSYSDLFIIELKFPCDIEIMNLDSYHRVLENEIGKYSFSLYIANNNQLTIYSTYTILKDLIPKDNYQQLKQLNEFLREVRNTRLLIKLRQA